MSVWCIKFTFDPLTLGNYKCLPEGLFFYLIEVFINQSLVYNVKIQSIYNFNFTLSSTLTQTSSVP